MLTTFKEFPYDRTKASRANVYHYEQMMADIERIENGVTTAPDIFSYPPAISFIRNAVNFIGSLRTDKRRIQTDTLKQRFNLYKAIMTHMSRLTYKEIFGLFPIPVNFDGDLCGTLYSDIMSAFIGNAYEKLGECGIDLDAIDLDDVIGDIVHDYVFYSENPLLWELHHVFSVTQDLLLKRDKELREKYTYTELSENLDLLL